ncbi:MAG: carboxypeptidase regulatory-like domain-containing protein [Candidatus Cloacimonetes bacterium]|nr:carboxypeptidase regulatory-like domain-containing protein [Candidatus Cloacimonadota bacterium]
MYNPTDVNTIAMLVGPQLSTAIPANTVRVKFWGKGSAAYHLLVGVMSNPQDPATFVSVQTVNTVANWNEYIVSLAGYTGTGRYIAFKHASAAAAQTIYVDGITFELIAPNDLAAVSVTGNTTPSVNQASNYTVNVFNWGTATQNAYSVKLMSGTTELASVTGPSIAPAATQSVVIPWTPTTQGPIAIYGKTVLVGDANPANDESPVLNIAVQPAGATVVTVGEGNQEDGIPYDFYYKNSIHEALYYEAELGIMGSITAVTFHNNFVSNLTNMPVKLWLGTTQLADLSAGWILPDQLTLVFDGTINLPSGENSIVLSLQTPYQYTGGTLVLYAYRPMDTQYYNTNDNFKGQTIGTTRGRILRSDTVNYDPAAPSAAGTLSGKFAKTSFTFVVDGMGSMSGTVTSGGNPVSGATIQAAGASTYTQTSTATGTYSFPFLPVGNYTVTASKIGYQNVTLPAVIVEDQNTALNFVLPPSTTVSVTGFVQGSDLPGIGLAGVAVHLDGAIDFDGTTNASGNFSITGVLSGNTYNYTLSKVGYQDLTGTINVAAGNYNMGTLTMIEVTDPPRNVLATENTAQTQVTLTWRPPGSTGGGGVQDFEGDDGGWVPSSNWTNPLGDWQWTNTYNVAGYVVGGYPTSEFPPLLAHSGTGLWGTILYAPYTNSGGFNYLTKTFNFSGITNPQLKFWSWNNSFGNFDYGQVSVNGTIVWGPAWDTNPIEWEEITIDLSAFANQGEVIIQFQQYATTVVNYAGWYIDDVYVGAAQTLAGSYPAPTVPDAYRGLSEIEAAKLAETLNRNLPRSRFSQTQDTRTLNGYRVWRLLQGNETIEATWTQLSAAVNDTTYTDTTWGALSDGNYKWAVKGVYTNGVLSVPAFSNLVRILRNDLSALTVAGSTTPSSGMATTYNVTIKNTGTQAKAAGSYTVKLMNGTTQLASVTGAAIAANEQLVVPISWTPTAEGPMALTGKVVLPADTVPANDVSSVLNISVMPAGVVAVTVGDGSATEGRPLDFYYNNSLFQCMYYPSELNMFGTISALSFYNTFVTNLPDKPTKLWLGTTQLENLSGGWILPPELTLVYDGNITYPAGENTVTIPLQTTFQYLSGNLVLYANRPMDTTNFNTNDNFYVQTVGTNRARKLTSNTTTYDPNAPSAVGTLSGQFPKTTFYFTPGVNPIFSINPNTKNWGTVLINSTNNQTFTLSNAGGGTLTISNIAIAGSNMFTLQNLPTLPLNLTFGQTATFVARYLPTAVGAHTATITVTDNLARTYTFNLNSNDANRLPRTVALSGNCIDTTLNTLPYSQNFDAVTAPALPPDWTNIVQSTSTTAVAATFASTTYAYSQPNCARLYNPSDANATLMLVAPPLGTAIATNTTRVKFWARSITAGHPLSLGVMVNPSDPATYVETEAIPLTTTLTEYVVAFNGYTGAGKHIVFKHGLGAAGRTLYFDDVMIEVIPTNDLAATTITGNATPTVGSPAIYNVAVRNWGTASQSTYTVKMYNAAGTELATAAGVVCAPGLTVNVPLTWTPTTEGSVTIYGKVILTGDQNNLNDQTPNLTVLVNPSGVFTLTVGDGGQFARVPLDFYYKNSIYQGLYYPAEMGNFMGMIMGVQFYNNFVTNLPNMPTKVWIGTTTETSLTAGWISPTNFTLVYDGTINYPSGDNIVTIPFTNPYLYLNGENLVLMFQRPMDTAYYNTSDDFQAQTDAVNTTRSRKISSDTTTYDPAALPTTGTVSGQFPKTTFIVIPGGVGHLNGTVTAAGGAPMEDVSVQIADTGYSDTTNAQGSYAIPNILPDTYSVGFSKYGYITQSVNFVLEEDETEVINVTLQPMPTVGITGTILASDTGNGIAGASISFNGYQNYSATSTATGTFSVPAVYANQSYSYSILSPGYTPLTGTVNVGATAHSMGNMTMSEVAYAPFGVQAELNVSYTAANITWQAPDPTAVEVTESFENATFPPMGWTQVITDDGAQIIPGVFPTWCRFGSISAGGTPVNPTEGSYQAGLWWDYAHQDEWLITPNFNCPPSAHLSIDAYVFRGSVYGDHYYVKVSPDNGTTWTVIYDASTATGGWNYYASPIMLDLEMYGGQQIKLAFHAEDPTTNDGLWYGWFIDNLYVGNATESIRFAGSELRSSSSAMRNKLSAPEITITQVSLSRAIQTGAKTSEPSLAVVPATTRSNHRSLQGYKVWRLQAGSEANQNAWTLLTPQSITTLNHLDTGWESLPNGNYRWAVKALYTADVASVPSFSNIIPRETLMGNIVGFVRKTNNQPIAGAVVTAGTQSATTNTAGAYSLALPVGVYSVTGTANNYLPRTYDGIAVSPNENTTLNIVLSGVANEDDILPVTATELAGNYPNPFNPETTISYAIKDGCFVSLEVYNLKGQVVRSLIKRDMEQGRHSVVFNGKDDLGKPLASGIYMYRLKAGSYSSTRKMMLME